MNSLSFGKQESSKEPDTPYDEFSDEYSSPGIKGSGDEMNALKIMDMVENELNNNGNSSNGFNNGGLTDDQ